ncbi:hypothetical protein [Streptomyces huiliensis]|uniref:hypothetical protein n=1 Tax=Streptomyces huiliensis TaxID=2876027 RepID=UPI001CC0335F|nr:hypothetical protein [Streptomyces huiliensis]MBZ4320135.1 hypothetical protein [Streptomyces huiliensis]
MAVGFSVLAGGMVLAPSAHAAAARCTGAMAAPDSWADRCTVTSGRSGAWTKCADGTEIFGPLQRKGRYIFAGECGRHGRYVSHGTYDEHRKIHRHRRGH